MTKKQKEKEKDIIISFADSMSTQDVTGSCVYVEYKNKKMLLECGMHHAHSLAEGYKINNRNFSFKPKELDYVFVMHSHADHIARLGNLYAEGCTAELIVPKGNKEIIKALLLNSAMIVNGDARLLSKRAGKEILPLFTEEDVFNAIDHIIEYDMYNLYDLDELVRFKFISSGHVADSSSIVLEINKNSTWKKIYYTSDLGNIKFNNYYVNNLDKIKNADIVISECTYGDKDRSCGNSDQREKDIERIDSVINQYCVQRKGKVLIPVFSFHRGQVMATLLYDMYHENPNFDIPIYMDSMLLLEMNKIFKKQFPKFNKVMNWEMIKEINKEKRKVLAKTDKPAIILASSGMLVAGASISWLRNLIASSKNCVIFCGYCSEGSLGWKLKMKDQKTITIFGERYKNNIEVCKLKSFSSHMQYDDLLEYLSSINCQRLYLHHGDKKVKLGFKKALEEKYEQLCKSTKVLIPNRSTKARL